ncbi:MAG: hypothetical protein M3Y75_09670 [Actinomycetota bacterium]|nr:hypothetical protein [Actinomycetota bacterium]
MIGKAVGLYHYSLLPPEEVDFPGTEPDVDLRPGEAVAAADVEEEGLEVASRTVGLDPVEPQAHELGLSDSAADEARG